MSKFNSNYSVIGPHSRHRLKEASPYATLMLDISQGLLEDDVSNLKLALFADKLIKRRDLAKLKNGGEILLLMNDYNLISETDTEFLENLLIKIGRKDLLKKVNKYHERRINRFKNKDSEPSGLIAAMQESEHCQENTVPKTMCETDSFKLQMCASLGQFPKSPLNTAPVFTELKDPKQNQITRNPGNTVCKELPSTTEVFSTSSGDQYWDSVIGLPALCNTLLPARSHPDGQSFSRGMNSMEPGLMETPNEIHDMVDTNTQTFSQESQMSISDDEKLSNIQDKELFESDGCSMQFSQ